MVLDVNGYNSAFRSFVDFAQLRVDANDSKAVLGVSWGLSPRVGALRVLDSRHCARRVVVRAALRLLITSLERPKSCQSCESCLKTKLRIWYNTAL